MTLDTVVAVFNEGATAEEIVHKFPTLLLADVFRVIGYYLSHRAEVDAYLQQQDQEADEKQHENRGTL